jgi:hypothetical protein
MTNLGMAPPLPTDATIQTDQLQDGKAGAVWPREWWSSKRKNEVAMDIRSLQKPLKEQYRNDPNTSKITIRAKGEQTDVPIACSIDIGRAIYKAEAHGELEAPVPAPVPVTFCFGLWQLARRSPVRWWLRQWAYRPNALR